LCKAVDRVLTLGEIRLVKKWGGKSVSVIRHE
jgi:molybdenum cofactor biosynthesis enzyme